MIDRRYPWFRRLTESDHRKVAEEVRRRTGMGCVYDSRTDSLYFHLGSDINLGMHIEPARRPDGSARRFDSQDVDAVCRVYHLGQVSRECKDEWARQHAKAAEDAATDARRKDIADRMPDAIDKTLYRRDRVGQHGSRSALVDGFKNQPSRSVAV